MAIDIHSTQSQHALPGTPSDHHEFSIRYRWRALVLLAVVWLLPQCFVAQVAVAQDTLPQSFEDILYLGELPVLLRLELVVDGQPWAETHREMVLRQFALLDSNQDGQLEIEQLEGLPLVNFDPEKTDQWDMQDADGKLSREEFLDVFSRHGQPTFLLAEGDSRAASRVPLFPHLDVNHDGRLNADELSQARQHLARLDYDDDETISTTELAPFVNPLFQQGVVGREQPLAKNAPFVSVGSFGSTSDLAEVLLRRYGQKADEETPRESLWCPLSRLGAEDEVAPFDENQDGRVDLDEATNFLENRKPDVRLQIELPVRRASRPKIKLLADHIHASNRKPSRIRGSSRLPLQAGKTQFDVRVLSSMTKTADNRNFYLLEFLRADQDKNAYLDANEFGAVGLNAPMDRVDSNDDKQVNRDEMVAFLERDAFASQSQVVLSVAADSRTLFTELDQNMDQRLTAREFQEMKKRLQYLDPNGDGTLEMNEMADEYRLMFSMGRPRVFQQSMAMQRNDATPAPRAIPNTEAPDWFRKMDRNQDGDLSWREFLGKRSAFEALDQDGDGLITADEVEASSGSR